MALPPVFPRISVVICTRDRPESLQRTLESMAAQDYPDFDVLVVDQSDGSETEQLVEDARHRQPSLSHMRLGTPGLSRAYNAGIQASAGELLAFTDDDVVAPCDWLSRVALAFAGHPHIGLLYGQVLIPPELAERENRDGVTPALPIPKRRILDRRHGFQIFGMGANFAARRQLFERIGGFDEVLGGGGPLQSSQDFDFVYRVFKAGESTLLEPNVVVFHYGFRSHSGELQAMARSYGVGVGGFFFKHIRIGDLYAARLFCDFAARSAARMAKRCLTGQSASANWAFLANLMNGGRRSFRFPIDRELRLYRRPRAR